MLVAGLLMYGSPADDVRTSGDEQGFSIPTGMQLPADSEALIDARDGWWTAASANHAERMSWYNDAKFGCFIHWGVYSEIGGLWHGKHIGGYTEHLMRKAKIPVSAYKKEVIEPFDPSEFDADEWMRNASMAGMRY
ncbi:MAG: alpha-L-fucosidase, partial [Duncaniella sp.]|nr:alpha-L-fucosidase [Duncaniella sp.]